MAALRGALRLTRPVAQAVHKTSTGLVGLKVDLNGRANLIAMQQQLLEAVKVTHPKLPFFITLPPKPHHLTLLRTAPRPAPWRRAPPLTATGPCYGSGACRWPPARAPFTTAFTATRPRLGDSGDGGVQAERRGDGNLPAEGGDGGDGRKWMGAT